MTRRITGYVLAAAMVWLAALSFSTTAEDTYYRWLDAGGNPVHSDRPPPQGTPYETISTGSSMVRRVEKSSDETSSGQSTAPDEAEARAAAHRQLPAVEKNPKFCEQAKQNLQTLETAPRIRIMGDDGEYRFLSPEEREIHMKKANDNIVVHCE